jgi:RluA family pseudouridine synthase
VDVIKLSAAATREFWEIPVLFEDEHLLVLDKPAGLLTSPDRNDAARPSLVALLHEGIATQKPWAVKRGLTYLSQAQRLDADVGGVFVLAKSKPVLVALADLFSSEQVINTQFALITGEPSSDHFEMTAKIAPDPVRPGLSRIDPLRGKKAKSIFDVVEKFDGYTAVRCRPVTARMQQTRVHLKHAGFPILGDGAYGGKPLWLSRLKKDFRLKRGREERPLTTRVALHAQELTLSHPVTRLPVTFTSPLPKELRVALRYLREFRGIGPAAANAS